MEEEIPRGKHAKHAAKTAISDNEIKTQEAVTDDVQSADSLLPESVPASDFDSEEATGQLPVLEGLEAVHDSAEEATADIPVVSAPTQAIDRLTAEALSASVPNPAAEIGVITVPIPVTPAGIPDEHAGPSQLQVDGPAIVVPEIVPANPEDIPVAMVGGFENMPSQRKHKPLKVVGITLGVLAGVLLAVYVAGGIVFQTWFYPNSTLGDMDISLKSSDEVAEMLDEQVQSYKLYVLADGFSYTADSAKLGLSMDTDAVVKAIHESQNPWTWPVRIWGDHEEEPSYGIDYNPASYSEEVTKAVNTYNETARAPQNATIEYSEKDRKFVVKKEIAGTQFVPEKVLSSMGDAIATLSPKVALGTDELVPPTVLSTEPKLVTAAEKATKLVTANIKLTMGGFDVGEISSRGLSGLIRMDDKFEVTLDEEELSYWVNRLVESYNTVGSERTYTRPDGKVITISGGAYGWAIDEEALAEELINYVKEGTVTSIDVPCTSWGKAYNGIDKPDWGNRYADVDLSEQHVYFYDDDGDLIWESDCITGSPDGRHNTVEGVWEVNVKESPSKLVGYENGKKEYETMVTYWMAFEQNAIGFHDATWQPGFGGNMYAIGYGSHGCVNLPYYAAQELYGIIEVGDVVIVHW